MASITCGKCKATHHSVESIKACYAGRLFSCVWLVKAGYDEDGGEIIRDCGAEAIEDGRGGFECAAGHSHVSAEQRHEEGWEYAEDRGEALALAQAGVEPRELDGHVWIA